MAKIVSVGGIVTILDFLDTSEDSTNVNLNVRLFAIDRRGLMAIDPASQSYGAGMGVEALPTPETLSESVEKFIRLGALLPRGHREGLWSGVVEALSNDFGISTDPETLMTLPFETLAPQSTLDFLRR